MDRLQQPTRTTCGQTCVAMLVGRPVDEVCTVMGRKGKTSTRDLINGLRHYGLSCGDRLARYNKNTVLPPLAILRLKHPQENYTHWVLHKDGENFDPDSVVCVVAYGWSIISFLEVRMHGE